MDRNGISYSIRQLGYMAKSRGIQGGDGLL
jgi:hypothetical protein